MQLKSCPLFVASLNLQKKVAHFFLQVSTCKKNHNFFWQLVSCKLLLPPSSLKLVTWCSLQVVTESVLVKLVQVHTA